MKTIPANGLALYCGECINAEGKEELIFVELEPLKALAHGLYRCDSRFHTEQLLEQLNNTGSTFGFIIIDGTDTSMFLLEGKTRETLFTWSKVNLPKKHDRGGQSQNRFARIRVEKRDNYLSKVAEIATLHFIDAESNLALVEGLVLAGCADLKSELRSYLDPRLANVVLAVVDVQYNGVAGFNEAIDKCDNVLKESEYVHEKTLLARFLESTRIGDLVVYGAAETMKMLEHGGGVVETILIWADSELQRSVLITPSKRSVVFIGTPEQVRGEMERKKADLQETVAILKWLNDNAEALGANVELISVTSPQGQQFVSGFGGIAGLLRYAVDVGALEDDGNEVATSDESFEW